MSGDEGKGERVLWEILGSWSSLTTWYSLKGSETLVKLLLRKGRNAEVLDLAARCYQAANRAGLRSAQAAFGFAIASAGIGTYSLRGRELCFAAVDVDSSLELRTWYYETLGKGITEIDPGLGSKLINCAQRLLAAEGSLKEVRSSLPIEFRQRALETPPAPPGLHDAAALLELAGHPHVLGGEALALLEGTGCVTAAALIAAGNSPRIVRTLGWSEAQARQAAAAPGDDVEQLPLGHRADERWMLLAAPRQDLASYTTFAAIRKLLGVSVALDTYRRDEKQRAALWPADALDADPDSIWASEQMVDALAIARRAAASTVPVLITGETGTGKEMLARALHRASPRADRPFLPFNCAAVPRDMLESQLFGYRRGAFTGAESSFAGIIRSAEGGTLFLDEIGEIAPELQPKLLRFLESHEIHPLGEPHPIKVDVRIVAATNAGIEDLVAQGRFREDLFYRLNVVRLALPPLRERREEVPPLVHHYLRKYADEYKKGRLTLGDDTLEYLLLYAWPGNVRQLANEVRRMVALAEPDATLTPAHLSPEIQASRRTIPATADSDAEVRIPLDQPLPAAVEALERLMVRRALDRSHGRVEDASRLLGISRKGLFLKRRRWGLKSAS